MKRISLFVLLVLPCLIFAQNNYQTLFLGNSYTYVNDLPAILKSLTLAGGDTLLTDLSAPGGYTLQGHSTNATSLNLIAARNWDFVVLQEQSQLPSFPQSQVQNQVYPFAAALNNAIKANDSCSVTVFYMTWGRKHGDASNCGNWPPVCTYEGMSAELRRSYLNMANQNAALVAPVGVAWWEAIKRDSTLELFSPDQSHPAYTGSYLAACVFYGTMYRRSPVGLGFAGSLNTTTASFLQQVAHDVVFDNLLQWRVGLDDASANFTWNSTGLGEATFSNASTNASSFAWDFGDGNTDSTTNPSHQYAQDGSYVVSLIATDGCTTDTLVDSVQIVIVGLPENEDFKLRIFPNPSAGFVNLQGEWKGSSELKLALFDVLGKQLFEQQLQIQNGKLDGQLNLQMLPKGIYLLQIGDSERQIQKRIVLE